VEETLTPEQMLQVRKLEMQLMPAMGMPFPSMFDTLGLTDDQKKEMNKITDELKAEFDRLTLEEAVLKSERVAATFQSLHGKTFASYEDYQKAQMDAHRQFVPSETLRKKYEDLRERGTKFVNLLQTRLVSVLTNEQLAKMRKILDATPEFAKNIIAEYKSNQEAQKKSPTYLPGADSWRPGDPLPADFVPPKPERRNFPRKEN
jgi:hypothetical protein